MVARCSRLPDSITDHRREPPSDFVYVERDDLVCVTVAVPTACSCSASRSLCQFLRQR
jgi:hypothetical protein